MKKEVQETFKYIINHDLAVITFEMIKSQKYSEKDLQDIFSYISVDKVNFAKHKGI